VVWEGRAQWSASSPGPGPPGCGVGRKGSASVSPSHSSPCHPGETYKPESLVALQREPVHQVAGLVGAVRQDMAELSLGDQRHWGWKEVAEGCGLQPGACTCLSLLVRESHPVVEAAKPSWPPLEGGGGIHREPWRQGAWTQSLAQGTVERWDRCIQPVSKQVSKLPRGHRASHECSFSN